MVSFDWTQRLGRQQPEPPLLPAPRAWPALQRCISCAVWVPLDDAVVPTVSGRCTCLLCFERFVEHRPRLPAWWVIEVETCLRALDSAYTSWFAKD